MLDTRTYLLRRCLRLEARIIALSQDLARVRPKRRTPTEADRAIILALRCHGEPARQIATQTGWSIGTVYNVLNAPFVEREVGAL